MACITKYLSSFSSTKQQISNPTGSIGEREVQPVGDKPSTLLKIIAISGCILGVAGLCMLLSGGVIIGLHLAGVVVLSTFMLGKQIALAGYVLLAIVSIGRQILQLKTQSSS
jgi:hypothetical protein